MMYYRWKDIRDKKMAERAIVGYKDRCQCKGREWPHERGIDGCLRPLLSNPHPVKFHHDIYNFAFGAMKITLRSVTWAQPTMPARMNIVSETTGFVESKGPRGDCFEWYKLVGNEWKPTHILHEENWLLK